ncbi:hypothetical protein [Microbacterium sp. USHLN272]|uniref:hypothetical protein n=1 Tax=Microbacterium sp. USHLN272 TaxID=3081287 RepID=UPI0030195813
MSNDDGSIRLLISPGFHGHEELELSFPPEFSDELLELLDEHGIEHSSILKLSAGEDLWFESVRVLGASGGLGALASILHTFMHRHRGKKFTMKDGEFGAEGYSVRDIEKLLELRKSEQADLDAKWKAVEEEE